MTSSKHAVRFPGESAEYRAARDRLLDAEIELRRQIEAVAEERRGLPAGGEVPEDYVFEAGADRGDPSAVRQVHMSQLFAEGKDTLLLYSFMYGPKMAQACPSCTSILDGLDGEAPHVLQRVNFAVVAKSPIARIQQYARGRGWRNMLLVSSAKNTYNSDYHGESADGGQVPALNVFVRRDGRIRHFWNSELLYTKHDPGQDSRHVDLIWPLWNLFDVTPEGRGEKTGPRLSY
jgi:predicted dithiol-disulfide oxidoreductase (DUF899 family)